MLTGHLKWKRAIEPCALAAVYITGVMLLPLFFPCTPAECVVDAAGEMQCSTGLNGPAGQGIPDMVRRGGGEAGGGGGGGGVWGGGRGCGEGGGVVNISPN